MVAYEYLSSSASIAIPDHFHTGSTGLEDAWQTKNANVSKEQVLLVSCLPMHI